MVYSSQLVLAALLTLTTLSAHAVVGPIPDDTPDSDALPAQSSPPTPLSKTAPVPAKTPAPAVKAPAPAAQPAPAVVKPAPPAVKPHPKSDAASGTSVDHIKGVGKYVFGAKLTDFSPAELQPVDPRAKGKLLRVSPYGQNFLVNDLTGLTWGGIPLSGLIITFHEGILIDIQMAMRGKKVEFYLAERAFKEKYGPCDLHTFPVETWSGDRIQVTLIMVGAAFYDTGSLDKPSLGKVEMFDQARWSEFAAAEKEKLNQVLDQRYQDSISKVKSNL